MVSIVARIGRQPNSYNVGINLQVFIKENLRAVQ